MMENRKVLYVSLEMSEDRIAQRFDSAMTLLPQSRLKDYTNEVKERLDIFRQEFPDGKLVIKKRLITCCLLRAARLRITGY